MSDADTIATLRAQLDSTLKDRALIIAERDRTFALMLTRAEAAEARADAAVTVKPLVWKPQPNFEGDWVAKTPWGQYSVGCIHGNWMWFFEFQQGGIDRCAKGRRRSEAGAKAAAKAHHDACIRAAIGGVE